MCPFGIDGEPDDLPRIYPVCEEAVLVLTE